MAKKTIKRLKRGKLGYKKPKYFIGSLVQSIVGQKRTKQQLKDAEADYAALQAKEEQVKKDRQNLTMSPEALKMKEGMDANQVTAEQENIDKKIATATAAATRGGTRVSAFEAAGAGDDAQRELSARREAAKRAGMSKAMEERTNLRAMEEDRSKADYARAAQLTDQGRQDIQNVQANQQAFETQMYGSIDAGIGTLLSDKKEKKNIKRVGKSKDGVPLSEFEYKDKKDAPKGPGRYRGVIAQDLIGTKHEDAVKKVDKNTLGVNYGKLSVGLKKTKNLAISGAIIPEGRNGLLTKRPTKDFMEGGDPDVTPGKFSHEENPIDLVQKNEEGNKEKIGEMTGGEAIVPPKNVTQIRQLIKDGNGILGTLAPLLASFNFLVFFHSSLASAFSSASLSHFVIN